VFSFQLNILLFKIIFISDADKNKQVRAIKKVILPFVDKWGGWLMG
jgi:hypothetical protein